MERSSAASGESFKELETGIVSPKTVDAPPLDHSAIAHFGCVQSGRGVPVHVEFEEFAGEGSIPSVWRLLKVVASVVDVSGPDSSVSALGAVLTKNAGSDISLRELTWFALPSTTLTMLWARILDVCSLRI